MLNPNCQHILEEKESLDRNQTLLLPLSLFFPTMKAYLLLEILSDVSLFPYPCPHSTQDAFPFALAKHLHQSVDGVIFLDVWRSNPDRVKVLSLVDLVPGP